MQTALLLTHSKDYFNIDRVMAALQEWNVPCIRLDTDRFPEDIRIRLGFDEQGAFAAVDTGEHQFSSRDIGAVWPRKIWGPQIQTPMEEKYRLAAMRESSAVMNAFLATLADRPWLDPLPTIQTTEDKYLQLRCARQAGLRTPKTMISNDANAVRNFYQTLGSDMICKLHTPLSVGMQQNQFFLYTTQIGPEDLDDLELLSLCPMIFQEMIPKAYELRVAYVDGHCFSGKIEAAGLTDWRQGDPQKMRWEAYQLPEHCQAKLRRFMQQIGLSFGAIDLIRHTDGDYVFLEVNPSGEWGMLEKELDLPIARTIAKGLVQRVQSHSTIPQNQPS